MATLNTMTKTDSKGQIITCCIIFILGFLSGVAFTVYKSSSLPTSTNNTAKENPLPQPHNEESHKAIANLEAQVTTDPTNFQAWRHLGDLYYDTDQAAKAIAAYNKSLTLDKGDANLRTDLGVMYRKDKQPAKAIEMFDLAIQEDPKHLPSRYNKGIVLLYDLQDPTGAIASWETMLQIDPQVQTPNGLTIRDLIKQIKAEQTAKK